LRRENDQSFINHRGGEVQKRVADHKLRLPSLNPSKNSSIHGVTRTDQKDIRNLKKKKRVRKLEERNKFP